MYSFARVLLCTVGLLVSWYAHHVSVEKELDEDFGAMCDISGYVSCSTVFTSKYGKGFGIVGEIFGEDHVLNQSNSLYGIAFFVVQLTGAFISNSSYTALLYWMTTLGLVGCCYLAYILAFILHDFCIVCVTTYVLTAALHYINYKSCSKAKKPKLKRG